MKILATKGRIVVSALGLCGIMALTGGCLLLGFFERIVRFFIKKDLQLKPGTEFFNIWKDVPIPVYQKIWLFNITNPEEFAVEGKKPILSEIGPYVFRGHWYKDEIDWDDQDGTVTYRDIKDYTFVPELSAGDQDEMVYMPNIPLLAVINYVEDYAPFFFRSFIVDVMNGVFESYNETLIVHKTVREMIYEGYAEPMVPDLVKVVEPFMDIPLKLVNDTFGMLHERKHIGDGVFTIKSGVNGMKDYTSIEKWNNQTSVNWWKDETCDQISGTYSTDGVQYAPGVTKNSTLHLFNPNLCRSLPLMFEKDAAIHGIKTLRFGFPSDLLATGETNPKNKCYCSGNHCHSGTLPMNCKPGAPFVISLPHFYQADEKLLEAVEGVSAATDFHKSYVDVEPMTGLVLNAAIKVQLNAVTKKLQDYKALQAATDNIIPMMWMSEVAELDEFFANYFKSRVQTPLLVFQIVCLASVAIGAIWTVSSGIFLFCMEAQNKPELLKHSLVLRTLTSVYTSVALWPPEDDKEAQISEKTHL